MGSFERMATATASTKRNPAVASGKRGEVTTNLASFAILPLMPVDPELRERMKLEGTYEALQTYADGSLDIKEGDILVVSGVEYHIRALGDWPWRGVQYKAIFVEQLKQ